MSNYSDIDKAVKIFKENNCEFELMHSVSKYPCQEKDLNLKNNAWNFFFKSSDVLSALLKMPEAVIKKEDKFTQDDWIEVYAGIKIAVDELMKYRSNEGKDLEKDISQRINNLSKLLNEIVPISKERIDLTKSNLKQKIEQSKVNFAPNRFEQELI